MRTLLPAALLLATTGCGLSMHMQGFSVSDHDGRMFVDGVAVDHHREVSLQGQMDTDLRLVLNSATGLIDVVGGPGDTYELVVDLYSEFEGDGEVVLEDGQLTTDSELGGKLLVNGIRGRLPQGINLEVEAGTGQVLITSFIGAAEVRVSTGTGDVQLTSCDLGSLRVQSGTGEVGTQDVSSDRVRLKLGTGSLTAVSSEFGMLDGDSGTGDFRFQDCRVDSARFVSGVGDVRLTDTLVSEMSSTLGTGRVLNTATD